MTDPVQATFSSGLSEITKCVYQQELICDESNLEGDISKENNPRLCLGHFQNLDLTFHPSVIFSN